jgi:hypothetical protein
MFVWVRRFKHVCVCIFRCSGSTATHRTTCSLLPKYNCAQSPLSSCTTRTVPIVVLYHCGTGRQWGYFIENKISLSLHSDFIRKYTRTSLVNILGRSVRWRQSKSIVTLCVSTLGHLRLKLCQADASHRLYNVFIPLVDLIEDGDGTEFWAVHFFFNISR